MPIAYRTLFFLTTMASLCVSINAVSLKNLYTTFAHEYAYLSPVHGAAMINSGWLEHFAQEIPVIEMTIKDRQYRFADPKKANATQRLVLDAEFGLFAFAPEFGQTTNMARPGFYATPEVIADLLLLLDYKLFLTTKLSWDKILVPDFFYTEKQERLSEETIDGRIKKIMGMGLKKEQIEEFKMILKQITAILDALKLSKLSVKYLLHFIKLVRNSALESLLDDKNALYAPYTTQMILLAFLYKQSITGPTKYMQRYIHSLQAAKKDILSKKYVPEDYTKHEIQQFEADLQNIEQQTDQEKINFMLHHYEMIAQFINRNRNCPEKVEMAMYCYNPKTKGTTSQERPARPDCTETGLLDLISTILYNPATEQYDPKLVATQTKLSSDLLNFLKTTTPQTINTLETRQDWFDLISGHSGKDAWPKLDYVSGTDPKDYELNATLDNVLKVLNYLFGTSAKTMEIFGKLISTDQRPIHFTTKGSNNDQKIIIDIDFRDHTAQLVIDHGKHVSFETSCKNQQLAQLHVPGTQLSNIPATLLPTYEGLYMLLPPVKFSWKDVIVRKE